MRVFKNSQTAKSYKGKDVPRSGCNGTGTGGCYSSGVFDVELNKRVYSAIQLGKLNASCV